jgi:hypothetical protein
LTVTCLVALAVAGAGWSLALTDVPLIGALSLAPAFGLAGLGIVGLVGSAEGVPLHGFGGVALFLVTASSGGLLAVVARRPRPSGELGPSPNRG